ncbi:hypothetical protein BGZ95_000503 [Linnemannia exigua]|uniref:Ion transport domain-containing protein n=1 Tax=Linnemannia exigua TaxID=604196 RepID=A0AAD4D877_9FUNG|nr:hypothetical protein BGZ95_000503 [Linnemannia exigua]
MAQYPSQQNLIEDGLSSNQTDNPNPGQAIPQAKDTELGQLLLRILNFKPDNEDRNAILENARQYNNTEKMLVEICGKLNRENHTTYSEFLKALLDSEHTTWVPSENISQKTNPIALSLKTAKAIPRAIAVPQIMIEYCIRMAKQEKDFFFVSPVLQSLHELVKLYELHTNLVLNTLRSLAFIPVMKESDIINQAIVAHPLKILWPLRKSSTRSIYRCQSENPVFTCKTNTTDSTTDTENELEMAQLELGENVADETNGHINQDRIFCHDVFQASFDMLWDVSQPQIDHRTLPQFWFPQAFIYTILFKCRTKSKVKVERHDFNLEMLDNPAIKALIDYKWIQRVSLLSVYVIIIVMALVFLVFKFSQLRRNRYCTLYNIIDVVVFALPLLGSVIQILNIVNMNEKGDISVLSFSVLVIFLHCIFELRVKKSICYFVTVIIEITGIWGSFGESLDLEGRAWGFDLIMVFYAVMMTMISLNILIALMNDGFQDAKKTSAMAWIKFKLIHIEEAEAITYNIPGFRNLKCKATWFPKVIYYTATLQQQENYKKYFQKEELRKQLELLLAQQPFSIDEMR